MGAGPWRGKRRPTRGQREVSRQRHRPPLSELVLLDAAKETGGWATEWTRSGGGGDGRAEVERLPGLGELLLLLRRRGSEARDLALETDRRALSSSGTVEDDGDRDCGRRRRSLGGGAWCGAREEAEEELGVKIPA